MSFVDLLIVCIIRLSLCPSLSDHYRLTDHYNGVDYGTKQWPLDENNLNHNLNNFQKPLYFWIPSIGISDLEYVEKNSSLRLWRGDFLISGMRAMSIYRMKMDKERQVIGVEEIPVGIRIRDIEIFNGKIYTLKDGEPVSIHIMQLVND